LKTKSTLVACAAMVLALAAAAQATTYYGWVYPDSGDLYFEVNAECAYGLATAWDELPDGNLKNAVGQAVKNTGDLLVKYQNADGGWAWRWNYATEPMPESASNCFGITAKGLIAAYAVTGETKYLDAAEKTADYLETVADTTGKLYMQDAWFLYEYSDAVGGDTDAEAAAKKGLEWYLGRSGETTAADAADWLFDLYVYNAYNGKGRDCAGYDLGGALLALGMAKDKGVSLNLDGKEGDDASASEIVAQLLARTKKHLEASDNNWFWVYNNTPGTDQVLNQAGVAFGLTRAVGTGDPVPTMLAGLAGAQNDDGSMWWRVAHETEYPDYAGDWQTDGYSAMAFGENWDTSFASTGQHYYVPLAQHLIAGQTALPEPASAVLLGGAVLALAARKRRRAA